MIGDPELKLCETQCLINVWIQNFPTPEIQSEKCLEAAAKWRTKDEGVEDFRPSGNPKKNDFKTNSC